MPCLTVLQLMEVLLTRELAMALNTLGTKTAAKIAMTASTPIISIKVKAAELRLRGWMCYVTPRVMCSYRLAHPEAAVLMRPQVWYCFT